MTLTDGRTLRAEVVGVDPAIDVALVRLIGAAGLPEAPLGNSDALRVGEWVCAIGNPLGYVHSVTVGVVSFIGRKLFDASLDDYIQTDAAINFGNSGGPLINARGEVIGINSAISSRASNIGFAVPINQAVAILPQLKARGKVSRGFLGVVLTDVTPDLQRSLKLPVSRGALVQDVNDDIPGTSARACAPTTSSCPSMAARSGPTTSSFATSPGGSLAPSPASTSCATAIASRASVKLTERPLPDRARQPVGHSAVRTPVAIADTDDSPLGLTVRDSRRGVRAPAGDSGVGPGRRGRARRARPAPRSSRRSGAASSSWKSTASRCGRSPTSSDWWRRRDPARRWLSMATIRRSDSVRS